MRRMKDKIEATVTNADYATSAGSASKATNATNATKATTADKLGTSAGSTTQPVYFKDIRSPRAFLPMRSLPIQIHGAGFKII